MNIGFFLEACNYINSDRKPPYFIDTKIRDLSLILSKEEKKEILHHIIQSFKTSDIFRYFYHSRALENIFYPLYRLREIPQKKNLSKNAFEHTLKVINQVDLNSAVFKWAALFHDLGKWDTFKLNGNFQHHELYSYIIASEICDQYQLSDSEKICSIVKYHMEPLAYQRNPNWTDEAVARFISRCSKKYVVDIIRFSICDKKAEHNEEEYIKPLIKLEKRVIECLKA